MDLRSIINNEGADASAQRRAAGPVTPGPQPPPPPHLQQLREYGHPSQAPQSKPMPQEYNQAHHPRQSPAAYQGAYQGRPTPSIQPTLQTDLGSPVSQYPAQSPYRSTSSASGQYPFPSQPPQSPAQQQPYPPSLQRAESYPQGPHPGHPSPIQHHRQYKQASPVPQTPPVATPGGGQYYPHPRPASSHSTSTPTSAHSQPQYFSQQPHASPIAAHAYPQGQQQRQQSVPRTPLGPPQSTHPRQASGGYPPQPQSPYQQRAPIPPSPAAAYPPQHQSQSSPTVPPAAPQPRLPSTPGTAHDPHGTPRSDITRRSQSERERSLSVSPKTRVSSQPRIEPVTDIKQESTNGQMPMSPVKKKINDDVAGVQRASPLEQAQPATKRGSTPLLLPKKKVRHTEPPIWAQSSIGRPKKTPVANGMSRQGRRPMTPPSKAQLNGNSHGPVGVKDVRMSSQPPQGAPPSAQVESLLGEWEPSITGEKPHEDVARAVADWLFVNVVARPEAAELAKRGINIEVEAKLGQLVDKDTNERIRLPVQTQCVLHDTGRTSFRSSMTEVQHKGLNEFLNAKLADAHPDNPTKTKNRVRISYLHRREADRFYELAPQMVATLPPVIRNELNPRHTVKVRVTHDQNSGQVLAQIIKARVADLDIYNPQSLLDCRISVNLEMTYTGDVDILKGPANRSLPERKKDRLSYTHSHYQIDLTQVSVIEGGQITSKEHELEIELSAEEMIKQGIAAMEGRPHQYAELIEGLVDNVRVLARTLPSKG